VLAGLPEYQPMGISQHICLQNSCVYNQAPYVLLPGAAELDTGCGMHQAAWQTSLCIFCTSIFDQTTCIDLLSLCCRCSPCSYTRLFKYWLLLLLLVAAAGVTSIPMFLGFATTSVPLCWFLQIATLVMVAYTMGVLPAICSNIYPAGVRISGFNFAYNTGIMTFGGLVSHTNNIQ
jgi:hypothetical protein